MAFDAKATIKMLGHHHQNTFFGDIDIRKVVKRGKRQYRILAGIVLHKK
jgi:hypothetical protein